MYMYVHTAKRHTSPQTLTGYESGLLGMSSRTHTHACRVRMEMLMCVRDWLWRIDDERSDSRLSV